MGGIRILSVCCAVFDFCQGLRYGQVARGRGATGLSWIELALCSPETEDKIGPQGKTWCKRHLSAFKHRLQAVLTRQKQNSVPDQSSLPPCA